MPFDTLVVIPTYNEADNLRAIVSAVLETGCRVLIVDDNSPDGTGELADEAAANSDRVSVLHRQEKDGLGPAYVAGFEWGLVDGADVICEMDADFSHDPQSLPDLIGAIASGADLAIGSRYVAGGRVDNWPWHRRVLSQYGNRYAGFMLGVKTRDMTAGYRAFRSDAIRILEPHSCSAAGYGFQVEMTWRAKLAGLSVVEVPITFGDRRYGESKMSTGIAVEALLLVTKWGLGRWLGRLVWEPDADRR